MDYTHMSPYPKGRLLEKFKIPNIEKFEGSGPPIVHLCSYHQAMNFLWASEEVMDQMFQQTLNEGDLKGFLSLEESRMRSKEYVAIEFMT